MELSDFDYHLPTDRIAQEPSDRRDNSRLLHVPLSGNPFEHLRFSDIDRFFGPGDVLVLNDTRVVPARLRGRRKTGGKVEMLFCHAEENGSWLAMVRAGGRLRPGERIRLDKADLSIRLDEKREGGFWLVTPPEEPEVFTLLARYGEVPLPPYIETRAERRDRRRYQTIFARHPGAVAAPTAGLHFSDTLLEKLRADGVTLLPLTLHVGPGTFLPIRTEQIADHTMHAEWYSIPEKTLAGMEAADRVIACGTTSVRALESWAWTGQVEGWTDLFIHPPYDFQVVDGLITNFHLPKSTLLLLVASLCGKERLLDAYEEAIREGYRFYSYGDAMLLL